MKRWYDAEKMNAHGALALACNKLMEKSAERWATWNEYESIYEDRYWQKIPRPGTARPRRLTVNRLRLLAETYKSKLLKTRVLPMAVVKDGDYDLIERARLHNLYIEGAFEQLGVYDQDPLIVDDCVVNGTYFAHVYNDNGEPVFERCDPFEMLLDDVDWQYCNGRSIHRMRVFDRGVAMETWPEFAAEIEKVQSVDPDSYLVKNQEDMLADQIVVTFSWHRRSGPKAKDGRHTIWIPNATLEDHTELDIDELPFAWGWNTRARRGMWGHPLLADLTRPQQTLHKWTARIDEAMWLMAVPRILVRKGAKIAAEKITNGLATFLSIDQPGDVQTWNSDGISPQAFQFIEKIESEMQSMGRTSLLSTEGEVPKNVRAFQALKLLEETDLEGLREPLRYRDAFYVRAAKLLVAQMEQSGGMKFLVKDKRFAQELKFSDIHLKENQYRWAIMPAAYFSKSPAARVDEAKDLIDSKLLPADRAADYVAISDLESETLMITAQRDAIAKRIQRIMKLGKYEPPTPLHDLAMMRRMVGDAYARGEADGAPEDRLELLAQLDAEAKALQDKGAQQAAPPPGGPGTAPPAPVNPTNAPLGQAA